MSSENINYIYREAKSKGADYISTMLFVLILFSVYGYLYNSVQTKLLKMNWDSNRCSPRYVFFSGFLNPLFQDPWDSTETNFNRCVATSIYQDPDLDREIKRNESFIRLHDQEISDNLQAGKDAVQNLKDLWEKVKELKDMDVQQYKSKSGNIIEKQSSMHNTFSEYTTQMFQVLKSTVTYIEGILLYRISQHKEDMDIDKTHERFMKKYGDIYNNKYKVAYQYLDDKKWTNAINTARDAIKDYEDLTYELTVYMDDHFHQIGDISESCYQLRYNLENNKCETIFPHITKEWIDFFPVLHDILKGFNSK